VVSYLEVRDVRRPAGRRCDAEFSYYGSERTETVRWRLLRRGGGSGATLMLQRRGRYQVRGRDPGHARLETTQRYTRVNIDRLHSIHADCHPAAGLSMAIASELCIVLSTARAALTSFKDRRIVSNARNGDRASSVTSGTNGPDWGLARDYKMTTTPDRGLQRSVIIGNVPAGHAAFWRTVISDGNV
jgi:hypothetical protein